LLDFLLPNGRVGRVAFIIVALVAALVFANSLANGFAGDDVWIVERNDAIHRLSEVPAALVAPYWPGAAGAASGLWRPVITGLFGIEWAVFGGAPWGFHLVNVLLHVGASVLVLLLVAELVGPLAGLAGGLLFAAHPVHVEAVAQVVGATELVAAVVSLGACLLLVRVPREEPLRWRLALLLGLLYGVGLMSKESAATLPGVLGVLLAFGHPEGRFDLRRSWRLWVSLAVVLALVMWARQVILPATVRAAPALGAELLAQDVPPIYTVVSVWPHYLRLLLFPVDLSWDYAPALIPISFDLSARALVGLAVGLGALVMALWGWRGEGRLGLSPGHRVLSLSVLWFGLTIFTVSNLLFFTGVLLAERTLYLPSVALALTFGWIVQRGVVHRPRVVVFGVVAIITLMGVRTLTRNAVWRDDETLVQNLIDEHPESGRAQWLLGDAFANRGNASGAARAYALALSTLHGGYQIRVGAGARLDGLGRARAAESLWIPAWETSPEFGAAQRYLAFLYLRQGRYDEAVVAARSAYEVASSPEDSFAGILGEVLERAGRWAEADVLYSQMTEASPAPDDLSIRRGRVALALGDTIGARAALARARERFPSDVRVDSLASRLAR
jgi:protein O-mannosyl-transferase